MANIIDEVRLILQNRDLSKFKGRKEDLWFEAKESRQYDFSSPQGKYELAKDVSAFANSDGGYLVIGLKTRHLQQERTDEVEELDLIQQDDFDINYYKDIIRKHISRLPVYEIFWVEDISQRGRGVGYIYVPPQDSNQKYFLISGIVEDNEKLSGILYGIVQRAGSDNIPFEKERLHNLMQNGKSEASERLGRIEQLIIGFIERVDRGKEPSTEDEILKARITDIAEK